MVDVTGVEDQSECSVIMCSGDIPTACRLLFL